jgi:high-affinity Fe2+/Pb2+ permease
LLVNVSLITSAPFVLVSLLIVLGLELSLLLSKMLAPGEHMATLTVVLAGKGVAALQEAGIIEIAPIADVPRLPMLGLFPTWQSVAAQLAMVVAIVAHFHSIGARSVVGLSSSSRERI